VEQLSSYKPSKSADRDPQEQEETEAEQHEMLTTAHTADLLHPHNWDEPYLPTGAITVLSRAVLTNGHTRHVPRAPGIFFLFEGPPTDCGEINLLKLIILLPSKRSTVRETR